MEEIEDNREEGEEDDSLESASVSLTPFYLDGLRKLFFKRAKRMHPLMHRKKHQGWFIKKQSQMSLAIEGKLITDFDLGTHWGRGVTSLVACRWAGKTVP